MAYGVANEVRYYLRTYERKGRVVLIELAESGDKMLAGAGDAEYGVLSSEPYCADEIPILDQTLIASTIDGQQVETAFFNQSLSPQPPSAPA